MQHTTKLNLNKPELTDYVSVDDLNENMDILDEAINGIDNDLAKLTPHMADESAHGIGNKATLLTTNKTSLVAALNELFQFANNGKTDWATVVGSPLLTSDTFAQMKSKTQTIKNTLASNLTAKGQASAGTVTLTALVNKVPQILTGSSKGATGIKAMNRGLVFGASYYSLDVSGLGFTPKHIMVKWTSANIPLRAQSFTEPTYFLKMDYPEEGFIIDFELQTTTPYNGGFSTQIYIHMSSYAAVGTVYQFQWWAWD